MYRDIIEFAQSTPGWLQSLAEFGTNAGLLLFAGLFVLAWWRARGGPPRNMAVVLVGPVATVGAYVVSEVVKVLVKEDRPCRGGVATIAACPAVGDWSFPSNHAVLAAGAAGALIAAWRALAWLVLPLAVLMGFSRVFVGVHHPHDVAAGFALGLALTPLLVLLTVGAVTPIVRRLREVPALASAL